MDEVFGSENFVSQISFIKTSLVRHRRCFLESWTISFGTRDADQVKYRRLFLHKTVGGEGATGYTRG